MIDIYEVVKKKQITTFKFDRFNNISLVVYLDKANRTREIFDFEQIYCNDFDLFFENPESLNKDQ